MGKRERANKPTVKRNEIHIKRNGTNERETESIQPANTKYKIQKFSDTSLIRRHTYKTQLTQHVDIARTNGCLYRIFDVI